jgi:hypothetical protein
MLTQPTATIDLSFHLKLFDPNPQTVVAPTTKTESNGDEAHPIVTDPVSKENEEKV